MLVRQNWRRAEMRRRAYANPPKRFAQRERHCRFLHRLKIRQKFSGLIRALKINVRLKLPTCKVPHLTRLSNVKFDLLISRDKLSLTSYHTEA